MTTFRPIENRFHSQPGRDSGHQLGHAGRRASSDAPWNDFKPLDESDAARGLAPWVGVSSSAIPASRAGSTVPIAMSAGDIQDMIGVWRDAALRSVDAGFDICEIHGAHGYLIHQFLSPLANRRNDAYGGDLKGRMRFALEITEAVRAVWPQDRPLFFRCSATDGPEGRFDGFTIVKHAGCRIAARRRPVRLGDRRPINTEISRSAVSRSLCRACAKEPGQILPLSITCKRHAGNSGATGDLVARREP